MPATRNLTLLLRHTLFALAAHLSISLPLSALFVQGGALEEMELRLLNEPKIGVLYQ